MKNDGRRWATMGDVEKRWATLAGSFVYHRKTQKMN